MAKYYANFNVNNGTRLSQSVEGNNKIRLWKDIKDMARGELFAGGDGRVWVEDEKGEEVFSGHFVHGVFSTYVDNYKSRF